MEIEIKTLDDLPSAAKQFLKLTEGRTIFAFDGQMGAGKTTFINAILEEMEIEDHSSSPTFSIINEYASPSHGPVFHFDFYRLDSEEEALDIGVEDIIYDQNYCFMEWPSKIENLLPENTVWVNLKVNSNNHRQIDISI